MTLAKSDRTYCVKNEDCKKRDKCYRSHHHWIFKPESNYSWMNAIECMKSNYFLFKERKDDR